MKHSYCVAVTLMLTLALTLVACGGGTQQVAGIDARGNPTPVGVVSKGTITGFGSVIVNGVRYDTSAATFDVDGIMGSQSDLAVGDVVTVVGTVNDDGSSPRANSVTFDDVVEGPVTAIDVANSSIVVLGQLVLIGADTSFDNSIVPQDIGGLGVGDIVEVSGFFLADGNISATRIEPKPVGGEFEVTGLVSNLGATTFELSALTVDFSTAQLDNFPLGAPENGQRVEAKGTALGAGGELLASRVEFKGNQLAGEAGDMAAIEGFVTRFASATDFDVEGIAITTTGSTTYVNGTAADLALNRKIEVDGRVDANGRISATKIEIKLSNFIRVEGRVDAVAANSLTVFGLTIFADALTRFEDKSAANVDVFNLSYVNVGDYLETRGYEDASGIVATRLERRDFAGDVAVRAFVDGVSAPNFTIRGVPIETNGGTVFRDLDGSVITSGVFFGQALGRLVDAAGTESNGGILASQVQFEN